MIISLLFYGIPIVYIYIVTLYMKFWKGRKDERAARIPAIPRHDVLAF